MKIFIHHQPGTYSDRWIKYCIDRKIPYKIVNCWHTDIMHQLEDCEILIWHWSLNDHRTSLAARQLTASMQKKGIHVFPDINNSWHYDDKVGQKYLLEAIKAPFVNAYVFYSKDDALRWIENTTFPKVFKLKGGAGSSNVRLVKNKKQARQLVFQAFGRGFRHKNPLSRIKQRLWVLKRDQDLNAVKLVAGGLLRIFMPKDVEKYSPRDKGYIYFQDFIANTTYDTRLIVIGNRCFGLRRFCRPNDFRASGSGLFNYNPVLIDLRMVEMSFDLAERLGTKSIALDILMDGEQPKLIEMSYCFTIDCCDSCEGYWDKNLNWHPGRFEPQEFMLDDFLKSYQQSHVSQMEYGN